LVVVVSSSTRSNNEYLNVTVSLWLNGDEISLLFSRHRASHQL
jgi:hypothetical protein